MESSGYIEWRIEVNKGHEKRKKKNSIEFRKKEWKRGKRGPQLKFIQDLTRSGGEADAQMVSWVPVWPASCSTR